ncbi:MAG TPA: TetR/AcrR family transcriptional regulator [Pseudonocardiaceae bacterium]
MNVKTRPGGRTARTRSAVLAATFAELAEHGYAQLTVEQIAQRSGVHKTTVYRRWGGVDGLLVDALGDASTIDWTPQDTGTLLGDLTAIGAELLAGFTDPVAGAVPTAVISAAFQSEAAAAALRAFYADRYDRSATVVVRAIERGEIPAGTDGAEVIRACVAPLFHRLFVSREPVEEADVRRAAAAAVAAAKSGVY